MGQILREIPKSEVGWRQKRAKEQTCNSKTESQDDMPLAYAELNIKGKDAMIWQFMADHEGEIKAEIERLKAEGNGPLVSTKIVKIGANPLKTLALS